MATVPTIQEMIAAGPAALTAFSAPKSQPEPMIAPTEAQSRPIMPTSRRRACLGDERWGAGAGVAMAAASLERRWVSLRRCRRSGPAR